MTNIDPRSFFVASRLQSCKFTSMKQGLVSKCRLILISIGKTSEFLDLQHLEC